MKRKILSAILAGAMICAGITPSLSAEAENGEPAGTEAGVSEEQSENDQGEISQDVTDETVQSEPEPAVQLLTAAGTENSVEVNGTVYEYDIMLPEGYDENAEYSYPVVYLLPEDGYSVYPEGIREELTEIMASDQSMDMIVVLPAFDEQNDFRTVLQAVTEDVDTDYRTLADPAHRALTGVGVGGYMAYAAGLTKAESGEPQTSPSTYGLLASIRGDFVSDANPWRESCGDVYDILSEGHDVIKLGGREINARAYCSRFNFLGADQQKKVDVLSGGERNRLHLARMLKSGANVLLLDEPTNDIDVNTMRALEDALENFAGCVLVVSHDRWFLDRIATHILAFEDEGTVCFVEGNYSDYEEDRRKRLGKEADQPHRMKFRRLTR